MFSRRTRFLYLLVGLAIFVLACRTVDTLLGPSAAPTATRARATRAAQRATFTPIPTETEVPPPTDTPEPTATPEPSETPVPSRPPATRRPPTARPPTVPPPTAQPPSPSPSPTVVFPWTIVGSASCTTGSESESSVTGKITANSKGAVGQFVQASSGPGGEPISDVPATSDSNGNYKVTFICGGKACTGDFWVWMVNSSRQQISPFQKFSFNSNCRKGVVNFAKR